jgi:hypothetical protein
LQTTVPSALATVATLAGGLASSVVGASRVSSDHAAVVVTSLGAVASMGAAFGAGIATRALEERLSGTGAMAAHGPNDERGTDAQEPTPPTSPPV